ncbi:MAG: NAD-binding protein [Desulfobacterales bacterium]
MPTKRHAEEKSACAFKKEAGQSAVQTFWIIGGGKFGLRAAETLKKTDSAHIKIVEKRKAVCKRLVRLGYAVDCGDGVQYLERDLTGAHFPDWIIPATPLHLAYEWLRIKLLKTRSVRAIAVPGELLRVLPNPISTKVGQLVISIADFKCPPDCPEPADICTCTGKPRPMNLHEFLKSIQPKGFSSVVIRSHQLAPGVGGYTPAALFDALDQLRNTQSPVLLSTACSCHGVMNAFHLLAR